MREPFVLSRGTLEQVENVTVAVSGQGQEGWGEAAPSGRYGESHKSVIHTLAAVADELPSNPFALETTLDRLSRLVPGNYAAKAAIDIALHDLFGKLLGQPVFRLLGLEGMALPVTSITLSVGDPDAVAEKAAALAERPVLKIKLGGGHDVDTIRKVRDVYDGVLRVDANEGWSREEAVDRIEQMEEYGVELVEQPVSATDIAGLRLLRDAVNVPIYADESVQTSVDIPRLSGAVDGVNLKLMKCGGIREMVRTLHAARTHGMRVMIGCMIESSLGITAAAHIAPLADRCDLDGNLLINDDLYAGVTEENGALRVPDRPGLGVTPR